VQGGRIVGRGWTGPGGRPHAEPQALAQAGGAARGATAYVSLEPCAHHGQTAPCAEALIAAGVTRVVSALGDPDPRVSGRGHAMLRDAGILVETGLMAVEAALHQRGFLLRVTEGRPLVTLKLAASLDGRIATAAGESRWLTGPRSRAAVHHMRARHDAVLIGAGTARADDPLLTVRDQGADRQPVRIVVSSGLDLPIEGALARSAHEVPLWLVHGPAADRDRRAAFAAAGARLIEVAPAQSGIDPAALMRALADAGLTRVLCEGGGQVAASLLKAGLVDDIALFSAGLALGDEARPGLGALGLAALADAPRWRAVEARAIGDDVFSLWRRA
jgi:diaminohydroxyphosphoribosylaminopyrimidine deaminase/5-amino-6-(5-phosphoribosylamino)uracil reductase